MHKDTYLLLKLTSSGNIIIKLKECTQKRSLNSCFKEFITAIHKGISRIRYVLITNLDNTDKYIVIKISI